MVDLDDAAYETYVKITQADGEIPTKAPPSFLNNYYAGSSSTLESTWQQPKVLPSASVAQLEHSALFTAAATVSQAERKKQEAERKQKMQEVCGGLRHVRPSLLSVHEVHHTHSKSLNPPLS